MSLTKQGGELSGKGPKSSSGLAEASDNCRRKRIRASKPVEEHDATNHKEVFVENCVISSSSGATPAASMGEMTNNVVEECNTTSEQEDSSSDGGDISKDFGLAPEFGDDNGVLVWKHGLKELRRTFKPQPQYEQDQCTKPGPDKLLELVRHAIQCGDWTGITAPVVMPKIHDMNIAIQQLQIHESVAVLCNCAKRYEFSPHERDACSTWILQVLAHSGPTLAKRLDVQQGLKSLLKMAGHSQSSATLECLGKWRFVAELAALRSDGLQNNSSHSVADNEEEETLVEMATGGSNDNSESES